MRKIDRTTSRAGFFYKSSIYVLSCWLLCSLFAGCDSEEGLNCTQAAGDLVEREIEVGFFNKITVFERTALVIKQGPEQKVVLKTGANLWNDVAITVSDGRLLIVNNNGCNLVRDYGITVVEVTTPELLEIRSSTGEDITSDGVLAFDDLTLLSNDGPEEDFYHSTGNFRMELQVNQLRIDTNKLSNFYLSGTAVDADLRWESGDGRLIAPDLEIQNAQIFHRGTNSWQLDVKQNIAGIINGYGDVILKSQPASVRVQETWRGRLIIE